VEWTALVCLLAKPFQNGEQQQLGRVLAFLRKMAGIQTMSVQMV
jgi:hypothetical protein